MVGELSQATEGGRSRRVAAIAVVAAVALNGLSAWMRHLRSGLGCTPWPECYGAPVAATPPAWANGAHRALALLLVALVLMLILRVRRMGRNPAAAWIAAGSVLVLAVLGPLSGDPGRAAVTLANLLGGWMLAGALAWMAAPGKERASSVVRAGVALALVSALLAANGGLIGARFGVADCPAVTGCGPSPGPTAPAHWFHRLLATTLLAVAAALVWRLARAGRRAEAFVVGILALAQPVTGLLLALGPATPALATAHGTGGQLLFLLGLALARRG